MFLLGKLTISVKVLQLIITSNTNVVFFTILKYYFYFNGYKIFLLAAVSTAREKVYLKIGPRLPIPDLEHAQTYRYFLFRLIVKNKHLFNSPSFYFLSLLS